MEHNYWILAELQWTLPWKINGHSVLLDSKVTEEDKGSA